MRVATGYCGCTVFLLPAVVLEFDGIGEIREGSTELRHGETAEDSEALTEGFCSIRRCELPKTLIFVQGRFLLSLSMPTAWRARWPRKTTPVKVAGGSLVQRPLATWMLIGWP